MNFAAVVRKVALMTLVQTDTHHKPLLILETTLLDAEKQLSKQHYEQTRLRLETAYKQARLMYGPAHPILVEILRKIADVYLKLGKYDKRSEMQKYADTLSYYLEQSRSRSLGTAKRLAGDLKLPPPAL